MDSNIGVDWYVNKIIAAKNIINANASHTDCEILCFLFFHKSWKDFKKECLENLLDNHNVIAGVRSMIAWINSGVSLYI